MFMGRFTMRFLRILVVPATALLLATAILLHAFEPKTPPNPLKNDKEFLDNFPYLAEPW